jgi:hypothetical protein
MKVYDSTLCFVSAHLAAHTHNVAGRNADFSNILAKMEFRDHSIRAENHYQIAGASFGGDTTSHIHSYNSPSHFLEQVRYVSFPRVSTTLSRCLKRIHYIYKMIDSQRICPRDDMYRYQYIEGSPERLKATPSLKKRHCFLHSSAS